MLQPSASMSDRGYQQSSFQSAQVTNSSPTILQSVVRLEDLVSRLDSLLKRQHEQLSTIIRPLPDNKPSPLEVNLGSDLNVQLTGLGQRLANQLNFFEETLNNIDLH